MKTTIELPDDLLAEAKARAAELRRPLRALIESGLRAELRTLAEGRPPGDRDIDWVVVAGGLPEGLDVADREALGEWMLRSREAT